MNNENKKETINEGKREDNRTLRRRLLSWAAYPVVAAAILLFFAGESWRQLGVSPESERKAAASFTLKAINGEKWNFGEQSGKIVVVNYLATWCQPCRVETPGLVNVANEYRSRGVEVVGVTMDGKLVEVSAFVERYQVPYPILLPGADPNLDGGTVLPTTFLYDKSGRLAKKYTGIALESDLKTDIELLLQE